MCLSAAWKLSVSAPTSRWFTIELRSRCRNSIGSSTVMMFTRRVVVDVVDHRGERGGLAGARHAGHQHQARGLTEMSRGFGEPQLLDRLHFVGNDAEREGQRAALPVHVDAETADARDADGEVGFLVSMNSFMALGCMIDSAAP